MAETEICNVEVKSEKQFSAEVPDEPVISGNSSGLHCKHRKTLELTHEEAYRLLELSEFTGDRPLSDSHVIFLTRQMEAGTFRWEQTQVITCKLDGKEYRMNGQHTCWARLNLPKNFDAPVQLLKYEADTEHDMRALYASIDRGKARSSGNVVVSYLAGTDEFINFGKNLLKYLAEGIGFWLWPDDGQRKLHPADDRANLMLTDHYQLTKKVGNFFNASQPSTVRHMLRRPVIAAMYATFDKAPDIANGFWTNVRDGAELAIGAPALSLRNDLMSSSIFAGGKGNSRDVKTVTSEEMYRHCILAWNAFRQNSTLRVFRINSLNEPRQTVR